MPSHLQLLQGFSWVTLHRTFRLRQVRHAWLDRGFGIRGAEPDESAIGVLSGLPCGWGDEPSLLLSPGLEAEEGCSVFDVSILGGGKAGFGLYDR